MSADLVNRIRAARPTVLALSRADTFLLKAYLDRYPVAPSRLLIPAYHPTLDEEALWIHLHATLAYSQAELERLASAEPQPAPTPAAPAAPQPAPSKTTPETEPVADGAVDYHPLLVYAAQKLKGDERKAVEVLCGNNGSLALADFALAMEWDCFDEGQWSSLQNRLNKKNKLQGQGWRLRRHDNHAILRSYESPTAK
jgi:hypothetical protein